MRESGLVRAPTAALGGRLSGTVVHCVEARASAAQFDPSEGTSATLKFKLAFVPQE
jgi:hypothetical protein